MPSTPSRPPARAAPVAPVPGRLVVAADGALGRAAAGWHEVTLGGGGGVVDGTGTTASSVAARAPAADCGPRRRAAAARRGAVAVVRQAGPLTRPGLAIRRPVHVGGAGAPGIGTVAADCCGERTAAVDCSAAAAQVWAVARAV